MISAGRAGEFLASLPEAGVDSDLYEEGGRNRITIVADMGTCGDTVTTQVCDLILELE